LRNYVAKHEFEEDNFNTMYEECLLGNPNSEGKVTFKSFIVVCRSFKREYNKYRTILQK